MTEDEWWAATGPYEWPNPHGWPHPLFDWLFGAGASDRKLRLACVACCQFVEPHSGGAPFPSLLRMIEAFADGNEEGERVNCAIDSIRAWQHERFQALMKIEDRPTITEYVEDHVRSAIFNAGCPYHDREWHQARKDYPYPGFVVDDMLAAAELLGQRDVAERFIVRLLHDIFGPLPFRDVAIAPEWLTSTVTALARGIYDEKAFERMPILADALQDAGCDNDEILNHCRAAGWEHVRGCWVVDLLLGKPWREPPG